MLITGEGHRAGPHQAAILPPTGQMLEGSPGLPGVVVADTPVFGKG